MPTEAKILISEGMKLFLDKYRGPVENALRKLDKENFVSRLWSKDASLWKKEPEHQKIINNSLGWLTVADFLSGKLDDIASLAEEIKNEGFTDAVLLGMGGSSLAAEVMRLSLPALKGYPKLHVLDSTDPGWVESIERSVNMNKTVFIVSSKSGTTIEPHCFYSYFFDRAKQNGKQFIAITDPGSRLESIAKEKKFRKIFINPSDIGGRFSALSFFGLVPAGIAGMDIKALVLKATAMMRSCGSDVPAPVNPGVVLGGVLGELARHGRDKVTVFLPEGLESFGLWIEQLVAESSGKEGKGIVPIAGESAGDVSSYGADRLFITVNFAGKKNTKTEKLMDALKNAHPVVEIEIKEPSDLGGEFLRWEIATAAACSILGIDAFDQPNVQEAKDLAKALLKELSEKGSLPGIKYDVSGKKLKAGFSSASKGLDLGSPEKALSGFLKSIKPGEYIGLLAYFPFKPDVDKKLECLRTMLRDKIRSSTLFGYGPRYLHSTGQLHKGGANNGVFIILAAGAETDLIVPGQNYTFGQLESAQVLGDFQALDSRGRRAVYIKLETPLIDSMDEVYRMFENVLK